MIVPTIFFKLLLWQSTQPYFILKVLEVVVEGQLCCDSNTWNHLEVCKQIINIK